MFRKWPANIEPPAPAPVEPLNPEFKPTERQAAFLNGVDGLLGQLEEWLTERRAAKAGTGGVS